eukprot:2088336-Rhodomonas_salina.2
MPKLPPLYHWNAAIHIPFIPSAKERSVQLFSSMCTVPGVKSRQHPAEWSLTNALEDAAAD